MNPSLEQIWVELADRLREFIRKRVSDPAEGEDILQNVFLKIAKRAHELPATRKLQAWIFSITRHAIIDHYRTRKEFVAVPETLAVEDPSAPEEMEALKAWFRRMIHSLPGPYREAILLTAFDGLSQVEMARQLGISVSGAKSRVQRGRQQLKAMLLDCCHFEFDGRGRVFDCTPRRAGCSACLAPALAPAKVPAPGQAAV
jgi:RNA polymerase sigma-70 factor (ECF subfamily)